MNIVCPRCGAWNNYLSLPARLHDSTRRYVCLNQVSDTVRCEAIFTVTLTGVLVDRPLNADDRAALDEEDRHYHAGTTFAERAAAARTARDGS